MDLLNTCNNLDGSQGQYADQKKLISKGFILYNAIYVAYSKWQNQSGGGQIRGCQGWGWGGCGGKGPAWGVPLW